MSSQTVPPGPGILSSFTEARFALVGFAEDESSQLATYLAGLGSLTHRIAAPSDDLTGAADSYSAVVLNLTPALTDSSWVSVPRLRALKSPLLAVGACADLNRFSAIQIHARELLFRPLVLDEFLIRVWRCLPRAAQSSEAAPSGKARILIADDSASLIALTFGILRGKGFDCHRAKDGREALALARTLLPDLLILDVNMPFMSGFEVLSALRADPSTASMKIMLFTAADTQEVVRHGSALGANSYLRKPFKPFEFLQRVNALLLQAGSNPAVRIAPDEDAIGAKTGVLDGQPAI